MTDLFLGLLGGSAALVLLLIGGVLGSVFSAAASRIKRCAENDNDKEETA